MTKSGKSRSRAEGTTGGQTRSRAAKNKSSASDKPTVALKVSSVNADEVSLEDVDSLDVDKEKLKFKERSKKRLLEIEQTEAGKRKVCYPLNRT